MLWDSTGAKKKKNVCAAFFSLSVVLTAICFLEDPTLSSQPVSPKTSRPWEKNLLIKRFQWMISEGNVSAEGRDGCPWVASFWIHRNLWPHFHFGVFSELNVLFFLTANSCLFFPNIKYKTQPYRIPFSVALCEELKCLTMLRSFECYQIKMT